MVEIFIYTITIKVIYYINKGSENVWLKLKKITRLNVNNVNFTTKKRTIVWLKASKNSMNIAEKVIIIVEILLLTTNL